MDRPHFDLSANELFQEGLRAVSRCDRRAYVQYLSELRKRATRRAADLAEELEEEDVWGGERRTRPAGACLPIDDADLRDCAFVTDQEIEGQRHKMIEAATSSIWLSTFNMSNEDGAVCAALKKKRASGVAVVLIVSKRMSRVTDVDLEALRDRYDIDVRTSEGSHSKCVIVDDEHVMIGSANLTRSYRDAVFVARSPVLARHMRAYLEGIHSPIGGTDEVSRVRRVSGAPRASRRDAR